MNTMKELLDNLHLELASSFLRVTKTQNQFNREGDTIDIDVLSGCSEFEISDNCYFYARSSSVGRDIWSVYWIVEGLRIGYLEILDGNNEPNETKKERILALVEAIDELEFA